MENDCVKDEEEDGVNPHDVDRIDDRMNAMLVSFMIVFSWLWLLYIFFFFLMDSTLG